MKSQILIKTENGKLYYELIANGETIYTSRLFNSRLELGQHLNFFKAATYSARISENDFKIPSEADIESSIKVNLKEISFEGRQYLLKKLTNTIKTLYDPLVDDYYGKR